MSDLPVEPELMLGLALLSGSVIILLYSLQFPGFHLLVLSSEGGSILTGEDVLLPGEPIHTGDRVKSISHDLKMVSSKQKIYYKQGAGSDVTFVRVFGDTSRLKIRVHSGDGQVRVKQGRVDLIISGMGYTIEKGALGWQEESGHVQLRRTDATQFNRFIPLGNDSSGNPVRMNVVKSIAPDTFPSIKMKKQWYSSSMESGTRVANGIEDYHSRHGSLPESLREVFGYWVRDRYGKVYLYIRRPDGFRLISGGSDQQLLTRDDRIWSRNL